MIPLGFFRLISPKSIAFLAIILLAIYSFYSYGEWQHQMGAMQVQSKWDAERLTRELQHRKALAERADEIARQADKNRKELLEQKKRYANEIASIKRRNTELASNRLRIPSTVCPDSRAAAQANTESSEGSGDNVAGTVVLPEQVERNLRELAAQADSIVAACREDQRYINDNDLRE